MEDEKHHRYIEKIRQIDEILCPSVESLMELGHRMRLPKDPLGQDALFFPPWVSEYARPPVGRTYLLTRASCCSTLLRIWRIRRRFPKLAKALEKTLEKTPEKAPKQSRLIQLIEDTFVPPEEKRNSFEDCAKRLQSQTFGDLNPLTASQVFSVLMDAGERRAHSGIGFLAFFAMTWSLHRRFPGGVARGAYLGPWNPTAYVTAKCLFPIQTLYRVCRRRAGLFERVHKTLEKLDDLCKKDGNLCSFWKFTATLDELSNLLLETCEVAIHPGALRKCSEQIKELAGEHGPQIDGKGCLAQVTKYLIEMLNAVIKNIEDVADEAEPVVNGIKVHIVDELKFDREKEESPDWDGKLPGNVSLRIGYEGPDQKRYWSDLYDAAEKAHKVCEEALRILRNSSQRCQNALANCGDDALRGVRYAFTWLAKANKELANLFSATFRDNSRWCRSVVDREVAHISAENYTDFDPAELVSGIAVAVRWGEMSSSLEVRDAVQKALEGAREDGSWKPGQPFYTAERALAVVPTTSDIVWTLATALAKHRGITVADRIFEQYVDWLRRTRTKFELLLAPSEPKPPTPRPQDAAAAASELLIPPSEPEPVSVIGWPSDRAREPGSVDLWATALAINALLEIRELFEYRLWQICEDRFTVLPPARGLGDMDPVDLGAKHDHRIQRRLVRFSRRARDKDEYEDADYALVLHGPPGSSKTSLAGALAKEMWATPADETKLVRITPADFTRRGEQRLDYEARVIFELLQSVRGVTVLFDEIDDLLGRRRPGRDPTFIKLVVPAMLNRLQDLREACPRQELCILFATNYVEQIEPALLRRARVDECIPVVYPDPDSRCATVCRHIGQDGSGTQVLAEQIDLIVSRTAGWPWQTLDELCRRVVDRTNRGEFKVSDPPTMGKIKDLLSEFQATLTDPNYEKRLNDSELPSSQLRNEVRHHCFAYSSLPDQYVQKLKTLDSDLVQEGLRLWAMSSRQERRKKPRLVA